MMIDIHVGIFVSTGLQFEDLLNRIYRLTVLMTVFRILYQVLQVYLAIHQLYLQLLEPLLSYQLDTLVLF